MINLTYDYFKNRTEQKTIAYAILAAIPPNVRYHNVIVALTDVLGNVVQLAYAEGAFTVRGADQQPQADEVKPKIDVPLERAP